MGSSDTSAQRKARGAFFTPPEITSFIADWAIRVPDDRVLEPSCGDAEFLLAAGRRLKALGAGLFVGERLNGVELHAPSAKTAAQRVEGEGFSARIATSDFFDVAPSPFDVVIGNPPYVRYQDFSGDARAKALEAALREGVRLSGLASSWAAFTVHASRFVARDGRLGLVLPAELLTVKYAEAVRRYLLRRFAKIRLVMFEELVFPDVQEEVVLLLAEGEGPAPHFEVYQARNLSDLGALDRAAWTPFSPGKGDKWLKALLPSDSLRQYQEVLTGDGFETLSDWGGTYLGAVTGNNRFFAVAKEQADEIGLTAADLVRLAPPGSRYLRGLTFSEAAWKDMVRAGARGHLFSPSCSPAGTFSGAAGTYISAGETMGVHRGYKCRNRSPWWQVPMVPVADLLLTYMDRHRPRLISNEARVRHLNSLYGVRLRDSRREVGMRLLPIAALSTVTSLGAELVGRAYGGGLLKLEPREADRLPMPSWDLVQTHADALHALRPQVAATLRKGDIDAASALVDRVLLTAGMGLTFEEVESLRRARQQLFGRRDTRAAGGNGPN
ncbi:MAG: N-6 DNA methylase [Longimicrobiales bacterium]